MLRCAHEIELLEIVPRVKLLKVPQQRFDFLTLRGPGSHWRPRAAVDARPNA
jgi:hypothetical protein